MAIAAPRWRAHRNEDHIALRNAGCQIGGKTQPPVLDIVGHQLLKTRLEDRDAAGQQRFDLAGVLVDADNIMTEIGKTHAETSPTYPAPIIVIFMANSKNTSHGA